MAITIGRVVSRYLLGTVALGISLTGNSWAQDCQSFVGNNIVLTPISVALESFSNIEPRGEFETSEQYQSRIAEATQGIGTIIIPKPLDDSQLVYDADRQVFQIGRYLFDNENMPVDDLWSYGGPFYESGNYENRMYRVDVVIRTDTDIIGAYDGTNAYGATAEVAQIDRTYWGIFERFADRYDASSLIPTSANGDFIGEFLLPIAEARDFRDHARLAFVAVPKAPWRVTHRASYPREATVRNPREITDVMNVLFADIQCALIVDGSEQVVAAFVTR